MNTRAELRGRPLMALRTGAIVVAIVSGFYALAALLVGSPLEFGAGLAACGACWITADFIEWMDERERGAGRRPVAAALFDSGSGSSYPVRRVGAGQYFRVGSGQYFSRSLRSHYGFLAPQRQRMGFGRPSQCGHAGLSSRLRIRC
jgi:hypothetical protein